MKKMEQTSCNAGEKRKKRKHLALNVFAFVFLIKNQTVRCQTIPFFLTHNNNVSE